MIRNLGPFCAVLALLFLPACFSVIDFVESENGPTDVSGINIEIRGIPDNGWHDKDTIDLEVFCNGEPCSAGTEPLCLLKKESDSNPNSIRSFSECTTTLTALQNGETYTYIVTLQGAKRRAEASWTVDTAPPNLVILEEKTFDDDRMVWSFGLVGDSNDPSSIVRDDGGSPVSFSYCGSLRGYSECRANIQVCPGEYCEEEVSGGFRVRYPFDELPDEGDLFLLAFATDLAGHSVEQMAEGKFVLKPLSSAQVAVGDESSCAIVKDDGTTKTSTVYCWGALEGINHPIRINNSPTSIDLNPQGSDDEKHCALAGGYGTFCALVAQSNDECPSHPISKKSMDLYCWGNVLARGTGSPAFEVVARSPAKKIIENQGQANWRQVAVGDLHTCGITYNGKLYCWGDNREGQLGVTTSTIGAALFTKPQEVVHPSSKGWKKVVASSGFSCALDSTGKIWCWGALGRSGDAARSWNWGADPSMIQLVAGVEACDIQATDYHVFARLALEGKCRSDSQNQLFYAEVGNRTFRKLDGINPSQIKASRGTFCYRNTDWYCLGENEWEQWGVPTGSDISLYYSRDSEPAQEALLVTEELKAYDEFSVSTSHWCGKKAEDVFCAGSNKFGQSSLRRSISTEPVKISRADGGDDWLSVSAGKGHTCAIAGTSTVGVLYCWGRAWKGETGILDAANTNQPTLMSASNCSAQTFSEVSAGAAATLAIAATGGTGGQLCGWTLNGALLGMASEDSFETSDRGYVLGTGSTGIFEDSEGTRFLDIEMGKRHACGLTTGFEAYCWGYNDRRQIIPRNSSSDYEPVSQAGKINKISGGPFKSISVGQRHTCLVGDSFSPSIAECSGANTFSQLGYSGEPERQSYSFGDSTWELIAGGNFTCGFAASDSTDLHCWGELTSEINFNPGTGPVPQSLMGQTFTDNKNWVLKAAGDQHACFVSETGVAPGGGPAQTLYCMGSNRNGQLGKREAATAHLTDQATFQESTVPNETGVLKSISAGGQHTCIINMNDELYCWGSNAYGQLGDPDVPSGLLSPEQIQF